MTKASNICDQQEITAYGQFGDIEVWPGSPYPLGATWTREGVNFAVFSEHATRVDLCLFAKADPSKEVYRIRMMEQTDLVWHCYIPKLPEGWRYGFRAHGEWDPRNGRRFNPEKLLIDPYTKAIDGQIKWTSDVYPYPIDHPSPDRHLIKDGRDSAPYITKGVIINTEFDWEGDVLPNHPMHSTIIYEAHVKGLTALHPDVPEQERGTYAGLAHPSVIDYLKNLGVTAVELMPIHHFVHDDRLVQMGLSNYWGYNSLSFFAPHAEYGSTGSAGGQVREFKEMVKKLHKAGLEVILDVVYNHTAEGNHFGPMLGMKGLDNANYYRLVDDQKQFYMDYTGTGNTLNLTNPRTLQVVMDSLRYWVTEMHVDGFRFDLASALARGLFEVGRLSTFLDTIHQDPIISQVKLIAEPWDVGPGGYQVGNFPVLWSEWNGKYRDNVRAFWRGDDVGVAELAYRLSGSSDLYEIGGRRPSASINFVTAHDGFTLRDLYSYNEKHNEANGEDNRDGESHNLSWNCGVEGPTEDPAINALRQRMQRNLLSTLFLSQGVPMLTMGDEYGRTQQGNNNAYCQDNEISWFDWKWTAEQRSLHSFTRGLIQLRKDNPIFHRRRFFNGRTMEDSQLGDILWINPAGHEMSANDWASPHVRTLGMILNGEAMVEFDERGRRIKDDIFLLLLNAYWEEVPFTLPGVQEFTRWEQLVDTETDAIPTDKDVLANTPFTLGPRSLTLFRLKTRLANRTPEGKRRVNIVDQVRRLWDMIQE
ncbi:glycogen debranching protein GlgX [Neolewinella lacunae]|uniref:Glycogen debranching protein GlgX n=1 Tax=Neolewinella lacunae TaxID=1517758 RepID=A0A923TAT4_9BACT|nr:glycogen debranching protein GlgX [Neolewinella lacunae]MBC6996523.1 glycogen debranching protein GlgX [Neolewinella lacunae]MDN3634912.1 glycogen debranching protein GlgX [Neolewinella lacunae]